jgi:hypothetical protein
MAQRYSCSAQRNFQTGGAAWPACCSSAPPPSSSTGTCARKAASTPPTAQGRALGVFLPRGTVVRGGDVLVAEDGSLVRVLAAPQPVLVITHCTQHGTPLT